MDFDEFEDDQIGGDEGGGEQNDQGGYDPMDAEFMPDLLSKRDAVIFLVDCDKLLFAKQANESDSQFSVILKSIQSFYKSKIVGSVEDKIGLIFYNTKHGKNGMGFSGCSVVHELDSPSAENIKNVVKLEENFERDYGFSAKATPFHEALWLCNSIFQKLDSKRFIMRIFLFTNNDNPHWDEPDALGKCFLHAKTLAEKNIEIELFPLATKEKRFDIRKFYANIITFDLDEVNDSTVDSSEKILDLQHRLRQREYKKRAVNRLLFSLGDDTRLGVKLYCPFIKQKRPFPKQLDSQSNKPLKRTVKNICKETGQVLYQNQISSCVQIGGEKIKVSKNDIQQIKGLQEPGMTLVGFKPSHALKAYHNYRTSYFVYPDESHVKGSSQSFDALIKQMIAKDKVAIVKFIARKGTQLRFCALIPQEESYDDDHVQTPPGFHLVFLPYADDFRNLGSVRPNEQEKVSRGLLSSAKILCNALEIQDFDLRNFEDPSLQKFFAHLQAHALGESNPESPPDLLQPDTEGMKRYDDIIKLFEESLRLDCPESQSKPEPQKKARAPAQKKNELVITKDDKEKPATAASKSTNKPAPKGRATATAAAATTAKSRAGKGKKPADISEEDSDIGDYDSGDSFIANDSDSDKPKKRGVVPNKGKSARGTVKVEKVEYQDSDDNEDNKMKPQTYLNRLIELKLIKDFDPGAITMSELKEYLKNLGLRNVGNKDELVDRILTHNSQQ